MRDSGIEAIVEDAETLRDRGRLERSLARQPVNRLLPVLYRSERLRAAVWSLDLKSSLRQGLIAAFVGWLFDEFNRKGEIPRRMFADHTELYQAAELLGTTGLYRGQAGLDAALADLREAFERVRFYPEQVISVEARILLVPIRFSAVGRESGLPIDAPIAHVFEFTEAVTVSRWEVYWERSQALERVGLPSDALA